jgi:Flp pilus assembly protein TadD
MTLIALSQSRRGGPGFGRTLRCAAILLPVAIALGLGGCAKGPRTTGSVVIQTDQPMSAEEIAKATDYWGQRYAKSPKDKAVALNYATALRRTGRTSQAVAVLQKAVVAFPDDRVVQASYGKALAANGQLDMALQIIKRAQTPDRPDWRLMSAEAAILDQKGQNIPARTLYLQAREFAPGEPTILSNLGMSYLLTGDLAEAEKYLRQASEMPGADGRVRQNLALVVGLQGRFAEAEKIASSELSAEQAAANIAYLKTMLQQQNNWQKLQTADAKKS